MFSSRKLQLIRILEIPSQNLLILMTDAVIAWPLQFTFIWMDKDRPITKKKQQSMWNI